MSKSKSVPLPPSLPGHNHAISLPDPDFNADDGDGDEHNDDFKGDDGKNSLSGVIANIQHEGFAFSVQNRVLCNVVFQEHKKQSSFQEYNRKIQINSNRE